MSRAERLGLFVIPVLAAAGSFLFPLRVGGIDLFGYRLLILILLLSFLAKGRFFTGSLSDTGRVFVVLGSMWVFWGIVLAFLAGLLWHANLFNGLTEVLGVAFGIISCLVLTTLLRRSPKGADALRFGWVLAFVFTGAIAAWEASTGSHLAGYAGENGDSSFLSSLVYSTLGNPNNYAAFLALSFPFLLWSVRISRGVRKAIYALLLTTLPFLIALTAARLALLALLLEIVFFLILQFAGRRKTWSHVAVAVGLVVTLALAIGLNVGTVAKVSSILEEFDVGGSASIRLELAQDALHFIRLSYGTGIGPANFEHLMTTGFAVKSAEGLIDPHNFWLEVGSEYGLVVLSCFVIWLGIVAVSAWRARNLALTSNGAQLRFAAESVLLGLVAYLFVAAENSSYIEQSTNWLFLGSVLGLTEWFYSVRSLASRFYSPTLRNSEQHS